MPTAHEPVSWLLLERYALGELNSEERAAVEARLAVSEVDRACLAQIMEDKSALPPLPDAAAAPRLRLLRAMVTPPRGRKAWLGFAGALCAAAATLIMVLRDAPGNDASEALLPYDGVKGADVALRLISERQGAAATSFSPGERFKVEVTCPAKLAGALRLFVVQGGEVFEPLPRAASFSCGNLVPWSGAFALDGSAPADVCLYWGPATQPSARDLTAGASCTRLEARAP